MRPVVALLALSLLTRPDAPAQVPAKPVGVPFAVRFPGEARVVTRELAIGGGRTVPVSTYSCTLPDGDAVFSVVAVDYPAAFAEVPADVLLDGVRDGLKGKDGKVVGDTRRGRDREFTVTAGRNTVRARLVLSGTRLYQVTVSGGRNFPTGGADDFLRSFKAVE
jgi:hypothetical protein